MSGETRVRERSSERSTEEPDEQQVQKTGAATVEAAAKVEAADDFMSKLDDALANNDEVLAPRPDVDMDTLMGEIDRVLEPNATDFVQRFQQKNGQ